MYHPSVHLFIYLSVYPLFLYLLFPSVIQGFCNCKYKSKANCRCLWWSSPPELDKDRHPRAGKIQLLVHPLSSIDLIPPRGGPVLTSSFTMIHMTPKLRLVKSERQKCVLRVSTKRLGWFISSQLICLSTLCLECIKSDPRPDAGISFTKSKRLLRWPTSLVST